MLGLLLILAPVLHFEAAIAVDRTVLYLRPGQEAALPCGLVSASDRTCSNINWLYNNILTTETLQEVEDGNVRHQSVRAARLSLTTSCSLVISNITAQDAGFYTCRRGRMTDGDARVYLSFLTISPVPPDADSKRDGNVILACSLLRHSFLGPCEQGSIRWLDETRTVLLSEGDGFKLLRQTNCVSFLSVKRQRGHNRKYTCQYVEEQSVRVEADYTPVFTDAAADESIYIGTGVAVGLVVLVIVSVVLIKCNKRPNVTEDLQNPADASKDTENGMTYMTVSHLSPKVPAKSQASDEEAVTYSMIRAANADNDHNHVYSSVIPAQ